MPEYAVEGGGAGLCIQRLQHTLSCPCAARRPALHATNALGMTKQTSELRIFISFDEGFFADDLQYP
jgi:hypothetical protein